MKEHFVPCYSKNGDIIGIHKFVEFDDKFYHHSENNAGLLFEFDKPAEDMNSRLYYCPIERFRFGVYDLDLHRYITDFYKAVKPIRFYGTAKMLFRQNHTNKTVKKYKRNGNMFDVDYDEFEVQKKEYKEISKDDFSLELKKINESNKMQNEIH